MDDATSTVAISTDFEDNPLVMRKRIYYIMVEMACIHEQIRSVLLRRAQLVSEGEAIKERLTSLSTPDVSGLDAMVP